MRGQIKRASTVSTPWHSLSYINLGCMVARATNASAVANDLQLSGKHWLIESWYKSAVPWVSWVYWAKLLLVFDTRAKINPQTSTTMTT